MNFGLGLRDTREAVEFEQELVEEHLDESDFLLVQRDAYLRDPDLSWTDVEVVDRRLLGHLAALCEYEDLALAACESQAAEQGEYFAAALLALGSLPGQRAQQAIIDALGTATDELILLAMRGLKLARQPRQALLGMLDASRPQTRAAAVHILAHRREPVVPFLLRLLDDNDPQVCGEAALALVKLGQRPAVLAREAALLRNRESLSETALLALLCSRSHRAEQLCRDLCRPGQELLGRDDDVVRIAKLTEHQATARAALLALGVHASLAAGPVLLLALRSDVLGQRQAAAASLRLITGQTPQQSCTVWEGEPDEPLELRHPRIIQELSLDETQWRQIWSSGLGRLPGAGRYLAGRPHSEANCLALLVDPSSTYQLRQQAGWMLLMQSERETDFEPDWLYSRQQQALAKLRENIGLT